MAPRVQPHTLYGFAFSNFYLLIDPACKRIFSAHGVYKNLACRQAIGELQQFLTQALPQTVFQQLVDVINSSNMLIPSVGYVYWHKIKRIKEVLCCHPSITRIKCSVDGNGQLYTHKPIANLTQECQFWYDLLFPLRNLVFLDLNNMSIDTFLQLLGRICKKLRELHLSSCIQPRHHNMLHGVEGKKDVDISLLTDFGLEGLRGCKELRVIKFHGIDVPSLENRYTASGVFQLIINLPKLEFIDLMSMGQMFMNPDAQREGKPLKLTNFFETQLHDLDFCKFESFVPKLHTISLEVHDEHKGTERANTWCEETLESLTNSSIQDIKMLELKKFPYSEALNRLIAVKGNKLTEFVCQGTITGINSEMIRYLGNHCPCLVKLVLENEYELVEDTEDTPDDKPIFLNLKHVVLIGCAEALTTILKSALELESLEVHDFHESPLREIFSMIFIDNKLLCLKQLHLNARANMSFVTWMIDNCEYLQRFIVGASMGMNEALISSLVDDARLYNLDFKMFLREESKYRRNNRNAPAF